LARKRKQKLHPDEVIEEHKPALVLVTGGRSFGAYKKDGKLVVVKPERNFICDVMDAVCGYDKTGEPLPIILMHGACPTGVDLVVDKWADRNMMITKRYPADWKRYGNAAGPIRNQQMVDKGPSYCIAFPGGDGTKDCVTRADEAGIQVFIPDWESYRDRMG